VSYVVVFDIKIPME